MFKYQGNLISNGKVVIGSLHWRILTGGTIAADIFVSVYDLYHRHVDTEVDPESVKPYIEKQSDGWPKATLKDHQIAQLKNELRDCAVKYHAAEQLRSRLGIVLGRYIRSNNGN